MAVLDIFEILFKTNAKESSRDVDELNKRIQDLASKGSSRSADEEKQIKDLRKLRSERLKDLKDETGQVDQLSESLIAFGLKATAAFGSFEAIKQGITNATNFNTQLEKMHLLTGTNVNELQGYSATFAHFGTSQQSFLNWFQKSSEEIQAVNGDVTKLIPNLEKFADLLKQTKETRGEAAAKSLFEARRGQLNLEEDTYLTLIQGSAGIHAELANQQSISPVDPIAAEQARALTQEWTNLQTDFIGAFKPLIPIGRALTFVLDEITKVFRVAFDVIGAPLGALFGHDTKSRIDDITKTTDSFFGSSSKGSVVVTPVSPGGKTPLGIRNNNPGNLRSWGSTPTAGGFAHFSTLEEGLAAEDRQLQIYGSRHGINTLSGIANRWAPSSENNTAAYIAGLAKATGYGPGQQLDLNDPEVRRKIANAINQNENGAAYGNLLVSRADNHPLNNSPATSNRSSTVNIGAVNVHTQATDASGIARDIHKSLNDQITYMIAQNNDGIAK